MGYNIKMTFLYNSVKKFAILILFVGLLAPAWAQAQSAFAVKPPAQADDVRLLAAQAWPQANGQQELMFKLAYVRGLLDAWQIASLAPRASTQALRDLEGLSLTELVQAVDAYYAANPNNNVLPPSSVILRIIAKYRSGERHE